MRQDHSELPEIGFLAGGSEIGVELAGDWMATALAVRAEPVAIELEECLGEGFITHGHGTTKLRNIGEKKLRAVEQGNVGIGSAGVRRRCSVRDKPSVSLGDVAPRLGRFRSIKRGDHGAGALVASDGAAKRAVAILIDRCGFTIADGGMVEPSGENA